MMVAQLTSYKIIAYGLSDVGLIRKNNEDDWSQIPEAGLYVLADGMGGHQAGEVAAQETVNSLCRLISKKISLFVEAKSIEEIKQLLRRAIVHVNAIIYKMSHNDAGLHGMGTTLCCLLFHKKSLIFAHVGDSRIYRLRNKKLEQLTQDHSLFSQLLEQGRLDEGQATGFLYKNIITKAIGTEANIEPSIASTELLDNDVYLMCTDGLSDLLPFQKIEDILCEEPSLQSTAKSLIASANEMGGRDNITVVMVKIEGLPDNSKML